MEEYGHGREFMEDHQPVPQQTPEKESGKPKTYRRGILTGVLASCGIFVCLIAIAAFVILRGPSERRMPEQACDAHIYH